MRKLNQKGVTLVEVLLLVIGASLIVCVGLYVYNSSKDESAPNTSISVSEAAPAKTSASTKTFLKIPELGVQFELNDKLKNAYYEKVDDYYYVSVKELDDVCPAGGSSKGLGVMAIIVGRVGETNDSISVPTTWTQVELEQSGFKKVGDTYYGFMRGNGPCYDPNSPNSEQMAREADTYRKAFVAQQDTFQKL